MGNKRDGQTQKFTFHPLGAVAKRDLVLSKTQNQSGVSQKERMSKVAVTWINTGVRIPLKHQGTVSRTLTMKQRKASPLTWFC